MENFNFMVKIKLFIISIISTVTAWLGILAIPFYILILLNTFDYITGIIAAPYRDEKINSYKGFRGIAKKICMWLLVVIGVIVDWLIMYATSSIGGDLNFKFVIASLVAAWLICNEIISILENMVDIGVDMPPFLQKFVSKIRDTIEKEGNIDGN